MAAPTLCVHSPIILDPADPTGILGQGKNWHLVAQEAARHRLLPCVRGVQPWDVQVRQPVSASTAPLPAPADFGHPFFCPHSQRSP